MTALTNTTVPEYILIFSIHISQELATNVLTASFLVIQDTRRGGLTISASAKFFQTKKKTYQDDNSESTGREEQIDPRFNLGSLYVESRGDHAGFVKSSVELDDDLAGAMIVDDLEFTDVAYKKCMSALL